MARVVQHETHRGSAARWFLSDRGLKGFRHSGPAGACVCRYMGASLLKYDSLPFCVDMSQPHLLVHQKPQVRLTLPVRSHVPSVVMTVGTDPWTLSPSRPFRWPSRCRSRVPQPHGPLRSSEASKRYLNFKSSSCSSSITCAAWSFSRRLEDQRPSFAELAALVPASRLGWLVG